MNCTYHIQNPITMICIAPHSCSCQRKLCTQCLYEHGVDVKSAQPIEMFQKKFVQKLKEFQVQQNTEANKYKATIKSVLSHAEIMLKEIWAELQISISQTYNWIEQENNSYLELINKNYNLAESSYTDLEKFVQIVEGTKLKDWNDEKISYLVMLEQIQNGWEKRMKTFIQKSNQVQKKIKRLINLKYKSFSRIQPFYESKEELSEIFDYVKDMDESIFPKIIEKLKKEKIFDSISYLRTFDTKQLQNEEQQRNQCKNQNGINKTQFIPDILINIQELDFYRKDYSEESFKKISEELIKKISGNEPIIKFLKFLVHLTAIDGKFIQCGSNSFNLLVEMKVDLTKQSFEDIRIKNVSLIGANFLRCNFNGSEFENVDISGVNLNGAQLFNCKWKNIKIHEKNKPDGHADYVLSVSISPDGKTLASGGGDWNKKKADNSIRLWDVMTGSLKAKFDGHTNTVYSVCFSPDGNTLVSGGSDNSICLWEVKTGKQNHKLDGHTFWVLSVCFSPDRNNLASGSADMSIRLWDTKTGQQKIKLDGHTNCVNSVCFSPDGNTLASGSYDKSVCLWDVKTGLQKNKLDGHSDYVRSVCFSSDGNTLASGGGNRYDSKGDNSIRLQDVKTGQQKNKLDGHTSTVYSVFFSPDGNTLASGGGNRYDSKGDNSIRLWDVKTGQQKNKLDGHTSTVYSICFSPDGNTLASGSYDNSIRLWDVKTGQSKEPRDTSYKDILAQFKTPLFASDVLIKNTNTYITILRISQESQFQALNALILKGEFIDDQGFDLRSLFKSNGSIFLENNIQEKQQKK